MDWREYWKNKRRKFLTNSEEISKYIKYSSKLLDEYEYKLNRIQEYIDSNKPSGRSCNWSDEEEYMYNIIQEIENILGE